MGCRGEFQRKPEEVKWVAGASCGSGEHDGGFRVAGDSNGAGECVSGVLYGVFRRGGDRHEEVYWVADANCSSGEHEGGFWVVGDSGGAGECVGGVLSGVFRRGGDRSEDGGRYPNSDSWLRQCRCYP